MSQVVPVSVPVAPARPPAGGSVHQVVPASPTSPSAPAGATTSGCVCGHSRVAHRRWQECCADGCLCFAYRRHQSTNTETAGSLLNPAPGHDPQEMTP